MAAALPVILTLVSMAAAGTQVAGGIKGLISGRPQVGPRGPGQIRAPGLISPRDPAAAIKRARPELQTAGLAQVSPSMEAQMSGLTPEEWELIVQQGGG